MPESAPLPPEKTSKSKRKNEMHALQKLGEKLIKLTESQLEKMELPTNLLAAIHLAKSLTANEAKRRHLQYIGKIMRDIDPEPIMLALKRIQFGHEKSIEQFHQTEQWRDKLISQGDDALNIFLKEQPNVDRQQLRQLIRKTQQDQKNNKNTGAATALFKYLQLIINRL